MKYIINKYDKYYQAEEWTAALQNPRPMVQAEQQTVAVLWNPRPMVQAEQWTAAVLQNA